MSRKALPLPSVEPVATNAKQQAAAREVAQEVTPEAAQQSSQQQGDQSETVVGWVQNQPSLADSQLVYESHQPRQILVELPFGRPPSANESARTGHLNLKGLSTHQRYGLLCLRDGLSRAGAMLKNGTPVDRPSHVIRYILEQAIEQAGSAS